MPIHDWSKVSAGTFHDFHVSWLAEFRNALNGGLLPSDYYAMAEQRIPSLEPDVVALKTNVRTHESLVAPSPDTDSSSVAITESPPALALAGESDLDFFRRKENRIAIRGAEDDELIAVVEVVSSANKSSTRAIDQFVDKSSSFLEAGIHLLVIDVQPRTVRDPDSLHALIWEGLAGDSYQTPRDKSFMVASYESGTGTRAYVEHLAIGDTLPESPLFLRPGGHIPVPLEAIYSAAYRHVPSRWRAVIEA